MLDRTVVPHHIIRQALKVIMRSLYSVCIHIQNHHIIQSHSSNFLKEESTHTILAEICGYIQHKGNWVRL